MEYLDEMDKQEKVDCKEAVKQQAMPTSKDMNMEPWDSMRELDTLPARIEFLNQLTDQVCGNGTGRPGAGTIVRVGSYTMWSGDLWGLRRTMLPFLQWHTQIGVCKYYIAYPGRDEATVAALRKIKSVKLIFNQPPFATTERFNEWRQYAANNEWAQRPGNWRQMAKQGFAGDIAFKMAREDGCQWMMHIDADEILIPSISLQADLQAVPNWVASITVFNNEAQVETADVVNKYEQITLFKSHGHHSAKQTGDMQWRLRLGEHGSFYQVYYNGKGIGRTDRGHIHMWGVHAFLGPDGDTWKDPVHNPEGKFITREANGTMLLHLSYTNWFDLMGKAKRACPQEFVDAVKANNMTKVKECFCLDFDMYAYISAVRGETEARHYWTSNALLSEGAVRRDDQGCRVYKNVQRLKELMIRDRLFMRIDSVQQALRGQEIGIRALVKQMGITVKQPHEYIAPNHTTVRRLQQWLDVDTISVPLEL